MNLFSAVVKSPIGNLLLTADDFGLVSVSKTDVTNLGVHPAMSRYVEQLEEYFAKKRQAFDLPVSVMAGTTFQHLVWDAIKQIPYGETRSYAQIAKSIGRPKAVRAVGTACGANPITIVVPCHRVVNSNGMLGGYTSHVMFKRRLLILEDAKKPKF